jgi:hypothetical protein
MKSFSIGGKYFATEQNVFGGKIFIRENICFRILEAKYLLFIDNPGKYFVNQ